MYCCSSRRRCCGKFATDPLINGLEIGALLLCAGGRVGACLVGLGIAETLICLVLRERVSLKSCSGAIHGCCCGGAGCVCCLRTQ